MVPSKRAPLASAAAAAATAAAYAALSTSANACSAFSSPSSRYAAPSIGRRSIGAKSAAAVSRMAPIFAEPRDDDSTPSAERAKISAAPLPGDSESVIDLDARAAAEASERAAAAAADESAATGTVNERLLAELAAAQEGTKRGPRSKLGKKIGAAFRSERTDEERQRSIEEARDLNGVNPLVALGGAVFALAMAAALWSVTGYLGDLFLRNPVDTDVYTVTRLAAVFRNVVMGLFSLASGFAGVTGLGLLLLGVRVGYGVLTGELDPTPVRKGKGEEVVLPNVWDLMMNKRPDRRGRRGGKSDDNPFGL